ncbi:MAG: ABC transporter permease [Acidobacteriota bacterium]|nr:MAG: ABC transporter permease [Acidobacteriota bacterium]
MNAVDAKPSAPRGDVRGWRKRLLTLRLALAARVTRLLSFREEPAFITGKLLGALCLVFVGIAWYLATLGEAEARLISPTILPSPVEVAQSFGSLVTERALVQSIAATLRRVLLGFLLSIAIGVPAGVIAGSWRSVQAFIAPLALFGRNLPIAALIPLTIVWFGIGESQKVMFIFIATVPFVFSDAAAAVIGIHPRYVETAQTLGAKPRQIVTKVLLPLAVPDIYTSLRHLFGLAFGYIMLAELINAKHGLGYLLSMSQRRGLSEHIFLILLLIGLLAFAIDRTLVWFQRGLFPYRKDI